MEWKKKYFFVWSQYVLIELPDRGGEELPDRGGEEASGQVQTKQCPNLVEKGIGKGTKPPGQPRAMGVA